MMNLHTWLSFVAAAAALLVGVFAVAWDRSARASYALCVGMVLLAVEHAFAGLGMQASLPEDIMSWQRNRLLTMAFLPAIWLSFSLVYARANRRESLRRWAMTLVALIVVPIAIAALGQGFLVVDCLPSDPGRQIWLAQLGTAGKAMHVMVLLTGVLVLMNLERTFRSAVGILRWRVKFMVLGVGTVFAVRIHTSAQALLYSSTHPATESLNAAALLLGGLLMMRALLRNSRSGHVDLYVSHTVLHRSATVLLSGLYLLVIGALAGLFRHLGGIGGFPLMTLVIFVGLIGLSVLLSSDRVRLYTKRFVSANFRRPQYDYRRVWISFAERTAGVMDRTAYCRAVAGLVSETLEALAVTIWVSDTARVRLTFGGSTSLSSGRDAGVAEEASVTSALIAGLQAKQEPFDLETAGDEWADTLREWNPRSFPGKGGHRVAVPLVRRGDLIGVMVICDRVGGAPFTTEEFELLKVIGEQMGSGLLSIDLSERLFESHEMEAFQTMSAFFVHDLKNTASTLSLTLENLPKYFDDPSFREDALKAIARSVGRIENLIQRLTSLRHKLDIRPVKTDIETLIENTMDMLGDVIDGHVVRDLDTVPDVSLDPEQIGKVITNLVLNAYDATGGDGEIRLSTRIDRNALVLSVHDNGCGMSPSFIEKSLFRPFRSTKKDGIGIGLFQSRMIVEAHGGTMDVESKEGHETTFRVRLPVAGDG